MTNEEWEKEHEEEARFVLEGAKREFAYYDYLVRDWAKQGYGWEKIRKWLVERLLEENTDSKDEWVDEKGVRHIQVDFLGAYCGFTLQDYGNGVEIGYCWAFDGYNTQVN